MLEAIRTTVREEIVHAEPDTRRETTMTRRSR
jgi:hypothetical protein